MTSLGKKDRVARFSLLVYFLGLLHLWLLFIHCPFSGVDIETVLVEKVCWETFLVFFLEKLA